MAEARTLDDAAIRELARPCADADALHARRYPGESERRQPVHTVYGGAQLFRAETALKLGEIAQRMLEEYAPTASVLSALIGMKRDHADAVYDRVRHRLATRAVEDFRIDFEDGYGSRPDIEEDGHAAAAAREVARGMHDDLLPPWIGIRTKPVNPEQRGRAIRTLDTFLTTLLHESAGSLPDNFVITLPKVTMPEQAAFFADVLDRLELSLGLRSGVLQFEIMVETPQLIVDATGGCPLLRVVEAARGRVIAAHFGTYDYTAACGITAAEQRMQHPACNHARQVMQVALAGTGVWLSDGSTAVLPVPPHRGAAADLTTAQESENRRVVARAWSLHYADVQDSLMRGFYQGWDLHPAQLVTRYAALYEFFLRGLDAAGDRLRNFLDKAAQATLLGEMFDDAATGQGLLNYFLRGINAGAVTEEETLTRTGLTLDELRTRSFVAILRNRS